MASPASLFDLLYASPVAENLASCLSAGGLLNLARTSSQYRAILHDFDLASRRPDQESSMTARSDPAIGKHHTGRWESLKRKTQWVCGSSKHTKGSTPRYCRFCSIPICEACIVRDSFGKSEKTHLNRTRYLCKDCWLNGTPHRRCRIDTVGKAPWKNPYVFAPDEGDFCTCAAKDRWVCPECKDVQNLEAKEVGFRICFGEGCSNILGEDKERRRICLWCDLPMTRGRTTMERRAAFDQKCLDQAFRTRNEYRNESWPEKLARLKPNYQVSRRNLNDIKKLPHDGHGDDIWMNRPRFLGRLDLIDYSGCGVEPPQRHRIDESLKGDFRYDEEFLVQFRDKCSQDGQRFLFSDSSELTVKTNLQMCKIDWNNFNHKILPSTTFKIELDLPSSPAVDRGDAKDSDMVNKTSPTEMSYPARFTIPYGKEESDRAENGKTRLPLFRNSPIRAKSLEMGISPNFKLAQAENLWSDDYDLMEDIYKGHSEGRLTSLSRVSTPESFVSARNLMEGVNAKMAATHPSSSSFNESALALSVQASPLDHQPATLDK